MRYQRYDCTLKSPFANTSQTMHDTYVHPLLSQLGPKKTKLEGLALVTQNILFLCEKAFKSAKTIFIDGMLINMFVPIHPFQPS